ncbi:MAG: 3-dehydroquinate synthase [Pirellulaceae bacterium]|nr:3-dehydroquinate synthase [Pirellulaceae bacterium]
MDIIDRPFQVPLLHRLRFTHDVFGPDQRVLADVLEPSGHTPARVQFWIDANVDAAHPSLRSQIERFFAGHGERIQPGGGIQVVPGGEEIKNDVQLLERMLKVFHAADLDRRSYVVVIGGGAVLDAVGFAAAIAHRGLRLVRLPTSTLAQGDSGVGVKNGVNLFQKKNWLGCFAAPWAVINDARLLQTLSDRDFLCGFSEAVKVALLKDRALFDDLCQSAERIRHRDMTAALPIIRRTALLHLEHITQGGDPFEMLEARPLDFGHWSAHKLESMSGFQLRHGEAVAIGVAVDSVYSSLVHGFPSQDADRVLHCLQRLGISLQAPHLHETETLFRGLEEFRQHLGGQLTLTMLRGIGEPLEVHQVDADRMRQSVRFVLAFAHGWSLEFS